jgi:two-component system, OmpR family, response regulator VicR
LEGYLNRQGKSRAVFNQKILLLDDNKDLLQIVQIILKGQGYDTVLASRIEEAVQKIKIHKPALILMDVFISDQDGREFCNQLKHDGETSNIRVIMMSGYDNSLGLMSQAGADDFMQKPFDYTDLLSRVQKQMSYSTQALA